MSVHTQIFTGELHVGAGVIPPVSSATFEQSLDPTKPFSIHNFGVHQGEGIQNQLGLYNGLGVWNELGVYNGIGQGIFLGGHTDAQPVYDSSAADINFNSPNGNLNQFWMYKGIEITNEATDSTSDIRLKKDIEPYTDCLSKILDLNPVYYKWREDVDLSFMTGNDKDSVQIGLIAQEVENIIPEVVANHSGKDNDYKRIKYSKLTPVLIGAIKEQQSQIEELKQTVQELSKRLDQALQV